MADIKMTGINQGLLVTKLANLEAWCSTLTSALQSSNLSGIGSTAGSTIASTYVGKYPTLSTTES